MSNFKKFEVDICKDNELRDTQGGNFFIGDPKHVQTTTSKATTRWAGILGGNYELVGDTTYDGDAYPMC